MLETFLAHLVGDTAERQRSWTFAQATCGEATKNGSTFKYPEHLDKTRIHTWLSWQDEPGPQLHTAVARARIGQ